MTRDEALQDVVTVIRLVPLGGAKRASGESAIVANLGKASMRTDGNSIFLVVRNEWTLGRIKVGDTVQWVAEPFGVVWLAERRAGDAGVTVRPGPASHGRG